MHSTKESRCSERASLWQKIKLNQSGWRKCARNVSAETETVLLSEWNASQHKCQPEVCLTKQVAFLSYLPGEQREEGSSLICFVFFVPFEFIFTSSTPFAPLSDIAHKPHKTLDDAVQLCHQHQHHCIQRLGLRWLTWKQNGKKDVWNMKACLRNLMKLGALVKDSGFLNFIAGGFKEFIWSCFGFLSDLS